jgi:hypothetical protein
LLSFNLVLRDNIIFSLKSSINVTTTQKSIRKRRQIRKMKDGNQAIGIHAFCRNKISDFSLLK